MTSPSYVYFGSDYSGFKPANRELVEVYEEGAIFAIPDGTTMSMDLLRMLCSSLTGARAQATKAGAGRRLHHVHMHTGEPGGVQKAAATRVLKARALRVIPLDNIEVDEKYGALFNEEGRLKPIAAVETQFEITDPKFLEILSGGTIRQFSVNHRNGCASSRGRSCTCEYLGQWA